MNKLNLRVKLALFSDHSSSKVERLGRIATATVGDGGWVDLPEPITVGAGGAFVVVSAWIEPQGGGNLI